MTILLAPLWAACAGTGPEPPGTGGGRERGARPPKPPPVADARVVRASDLSAEEVSEFQCAWRLFVTHDPRWPSARDRWLERGGAAPYLLAENLFRYFWSASRLNKRDEVGRVAAEAATVGEPAVAHYVKALVTDRWPLREPVTVEVFNPDNIKQPIQKTFTHYDIDNLTRQHAAYVLATIGPPAVPLLTSPRVLDAELASSRRYAAYVLGAIATDEAVATLGRLVRERPDWRDRGAAAKGLGFALPKNPAARPLLEAALEDPDEFVQRKAREGLEGRTRPEF